MNIFQAEQKKGQTTGGGGGGCLRVKEHSVVFNHVIKAVWERPGCNGAFSVLNLPEKIIAQISKAVSSVGGGGGRRQGGWGGGESQSKRLYNVPSEIM